MLGRREQKRNGTRGEGGWGDIGKEKREDGRGGGKRGREERERESGRQTISDQDLQEVFMH